MLHCSEAFAFSLRSQDTYDDGHLAARLSTFLLAFPGLSVSELIGEVERKAISLSLRHQLLLWDQLDGVAARRVGTYSH